MSLIALAYLKRLRRPNNIALDRSLLVTRTIEENASVGGHVPAPDSHGQAALLLVESLLHGLIARKVIGVADATEIVTVAAEVKQEIADDLGDTPATLARSLTLLEAIGASLARDLPPPATAAFI